MDRSHTRVQNESHAARTVLVTLPQRIVFDGDRDVVLEVDVMPRVHVVAGLAVDLECGHSLLSLERLVWDDHY